MKFKHLFISYGRRESLEFVGRLHQKLKLAGYQAWFDKVNIPDGDDYAQRINHGIESADNFVYVMAPRCLTSPYCLMELEYARLLGKRVIPINHMVIFQTPPQALSEGDKQGLRGFYQHYQCPEQNIHTSQDVLDRSLALIGKTDWLDASEQLTDEDCDRIAAWAQPYENHWHKHEVLVYLNTFEFPKFGKSIASLESVVERLTSVLERHKEYVHQHTEILADALTWQRNQKANHYLLVGKERITAEEWLLTKFKAGEQVPCQPTDLQCEFICEARKNAENSMTDGFICYEASEKDIRDKVVCSLSRYAITTWTHDCDIQKGTDYERNIEEWIENADNLIYFISPHSVVSEYCQIELTHALKYHKRIIPLLVAPTPEPDIPEVIRGLQYIDFTDNVVQTDYDHDIDDILNILNRDKAYYAQHKVLLSRALKWELENRKPAFLLRGYNLENAQTWLRLNDKRKQHPPTPLHKELIIASEAAKGQLGTEVFISYSSKNGDFARQLNIALQEAGKTTWFDQESIRSGVDFETALFKGIDSSDNVIFIISPEAVESEYCKREVNYAIKQHKRFITVLHREPKAGTMPKVLRRIQWIDFQNQPFEQSFPELIQAIELDREYAHQHTVLQQRASEWLEQGRHSDFLLNNSACASAENWLAVAAESLRQPAPTALQKDYIQQSRAAIIKAAQAVLKPRNDALRSQSWFLADLARQETAKGNATHGILLALEALPNQHSVPDRPYVWTAKEQLYDAVLKCHERWVLQGHHSPVLHADFSPDGSAVVTASEAGEVCLWESNNGKLLQVFYEHAKRVNHVAFSPDSQQVITASWDGTACLWEAHTGQLRYRLVGHFEGINRAVFSSDGLLVVTASKDNTACIWEVSSGKRLYTLKGHSDDVNHAAFSPDGLLVVTASKDNTACLWEADTGKLCQTLVGHSDHMQYAGFSPDGSLVVTASKDKTACLWETHSGQLLHTLNGHQAEVSHALFSPDGQIVATASQDNTARLWAVHSGQWLHTLDGHQDGVYRVAFSPDSSLVVTASDDHTARLWDVASGTVRHILAGHTDWVSQAAFSPDGQYVIT